MTSDHNVYMRYLGDGVFQIIVSRATIVATSFPKYHSCSAQPEPVSFEVKLSKYSSTVSHFDLPHDFLAFLEETEYTAMYWTGPVPSHISCKLLFRSPTKKSVKIGKGWKTFCKKNGFVAGKKLVFKFVYPTQNNVVPVKMLDN